MINIWGQYKNHKPEKIDSASKKSEALYLAREYQMAYGSDWRVWAGTRERRIDE